MAQRVRILTEAQRDAQKARSKAWRRANPQLPMTEAEKAAKRPYKAAWARAHRKPKSDAEKAARQSPEAKAGARATFQRWKEANPEIPKENWARWAAANKDHLRAREAARDPGEGAARRARRRAAIHQATPAWLTPEQKMQIQNWYARGAALGHHVDHIIPLCGKNVRGLHVPWNLQTLHPAENLAKGNRLLEAT